MVGDVLIYATRYASTIHGDKEKLLNSVKMVTSDVATIEVSNVAKKSPK